MSKDTIYREDAIKAYNEAMDELVKWQMEEWQLGDFSECEFNTTDCKHIVRKIEAIPSAERKGEWIPYEASLNFGDGEGYVIEHKCSACGYLWGEPDYKFCPNCGAYMKGAEDD